MSGGGDRARARVNVLARRLRDDCAAVIAATDGGDAKWTTDAVPLRRRSAPPMPKC